MEDFSRDIIKDVILSLQESVDAIKAYCSTIDQTIDELERYLMKT